ncbi:MAG: hypothetical protein AB1469_05160 [Pseudomonadota bacterium]
MAKASDNQSRGKRGGEAISQNREHMSKIGKKGGEARGQQMSTQKRQSRNKPTL